MGINPHNTLCIRPLILGAKAPPALDVASAVRSTSEWNSLEFSLGTLTAKSSSIKNVQTGSRFNTRGEFQTGAVGKSTSWAVGPNEPAWVCIKIYVSVCTAASVRSDCPKTSLCPLRKMVEKV